MVDTSNSSAVAREVYLALFSELAINGDYLQSDSSTQFSMSEVGMYAAAGAVVAKFFDGVVGRLGEKASDVMVRYLRERRRTPEADADPDMAVATLRLLYAEPAMVTPEDGRHDEERWVTEELVARGLSRPAAVASAVRIVRLLRRDELP